MRIGVIAVLGGTIAMAMGLSLGRDLTAGLFSPADQLLVSNLVLVFVGLLMLSQSLGVAIDELYSRGDLEWLMTTPVPVRRMLGVRMLGMVAGIVWPWLLMLGPFAVGAAVSGQPRLLAVFPVLLALAGLVSALGTTVAVYFTCFFGLRRTRTAASMLSVAAGVLGFLAGPLVPAAQGALHQGFGAEDPQDGLFWWPARALLGEGLPLVTAMVFGLGAATIAGRLLEGRFVQGVTGTRPSRPRRVRLTAFRVDGIVRTLLRTELRRMWRTPGLWGRAVQFLPMLLPGALVVWRGDDTPVALGLLPVFAAAGLGRLFITAATSGDEAAELALTAPIPAALIDRVKLAASALSVVAILGLPFLAVALRRPADAPMLLTGLAAAVASALLIGVWHPGAPKRLDLGPTGRSSLGGRVCSFTNMAACCGATALALDHNAWAAVPAAVAVISLLVARPPAGRPLARATSARPI